MFVLKSFQSPQNKLEFNIYNNSEILCNIRDKNVDTTYVFSTLKFSSLPENVELYNVSWNSIKNMLKTKIREHKQNSQYTNIICFFFFLNK